MNARLWWVGRTVIASSLLWMVCAVPAAHAQLSPYINAGGIARGPIQIPVSTPAVTTNKLYNVSGELWFNGTLIKAPSFDAGTTIKVAMARPVIVSVTPGAAGTLADGTYTIGLSALDAAGNETLGSTTTTCVISGAGGSGSCAVAYTAPAGIPATAGNRVWIASGATTPTHFFADNATPYTLTTAAGTAATYPTANTAYVTLLSPSGTSWIAGGPTLWPVGSASAPTLAFIGDTDTGIYWAAANTWALATGGTSRLTVDGSGVVTFTGQEYSETHDLGTYTSGTLAIDWNNGNNQKVVLGGNVAAITMANGKDGGSYSLQIIQDGTGGRTVTGWPSTTPAVRWPRGLEPTITTTASVGDLVTFLYRSSDTIYLASVVQNFSPTLVAGPFDAKVILQQANTNWPSAQALGALTTGLMKVTTTSGVVSTASSGVDYIAPTGGTTLELSTSLAVPLLYNYGTTQNLLRAGSTDLTDNTATAVFTIAMADGARTGGELSYTIEVTDAGADNDSYTGALRFAAQRKGATVTCSIGTIGTDVVTKSHAGADLAVTGTCDATSGTSIVIKLTSDTALTATTHKAWWRLMMNKSHGSVS